MPRQPRPAFEDRFLTEAEVQDLTRISIPALQADRSSGGPLCLPHYKFGTRVRYRLSEVLAWAEARRVVPPGASG